MSVWKRNGAWYYQFRVKGVQYSGRARGAESEDEARQREQERREEVIAAQVSPPPVNGTPKEIATFIIELTIKIKEG